MLCYDIKHPFVKGKMLGVLEIKEEDINPDEVIDSIFDLADKLGLDHDYTIQKLAYLRTSFISDGLEYAPIDDIEVTVEYDYKGKTSFIKNITVRAMKDLGQPPLSQLLGIK